MEFIKTVDPLELSGLGIIGVFIIGLCLLAFTQWLQAFPFREVYKDFKEFLQDLFNK